MLIFTPQFDVFFIYYAHAYLFTLVLFVYLLLKRAPRKIGYQPIGLPSQNKEFTYLLTYLLIKHSILEIESRYVILYNKALQFFYTHERSWLRGHGRKMYAHGDVFFFFAV